MRLLRVLAALVAAAFAALAADIPLGGLPETARPTANRAALKAARGAEAGAALNALN